MDYSDVEIIVKNIPKLESLGDGLCVSRYFYRFIDLLPDLNDINILAKQLNWKFIFTKETHYLDKDVCIYLWVNVERLSAREAIFSVWTNEPEECCAVVYGAYSLPKKIEKLIGAVESIQGDLREYWIG